MVTAVERAFQILRLVGASTQPLRVSEVAAQLGLPRSGTYELANTLKALGALVQRPDGRLEIGPTLFTLGATYAQSLDLARVATEIAEDIAAECDETVQVAVLEGRHTVYIAKAESSHPLRLVSAVGRRLPAHCTALGKVQLALLAPEELAARLEGVQLERLTENSITNRHELERELATTRARGYAFDNCESNPGVFCVAAPVWDALGRNVAGMSISVPAIRIDPARRDELRDLVIRGANALSQHLGYKAPEETAPSAQVIPLRSNRERTDTHGDAPESARR